MQWLVQGARPNDSLFFHCRTPLFSVTRATPMDITDSGHGGQTKDLNGDEQDGYDEGGYPPLAPSISLIAISHLPREVPFLA